MQQTNAASQNHVPRYVLEAALRVLQMFSGVCRRASSTDMAIVEACTGADAHEPLDAKACEIIHRALAEAKERRDRMELAS